MKKAIEGFTKFDAELEREVSFGRIVFSLKENSSLGRYERLAHDGNTMKMVSLVAEPNHIKAIRAMLCSNKGTANIHANCTAAEAGTWFGDREIYEWFAAKLQRVCEPSLRHYVRARNFRTVGVNWTAVFGVRGREPAGTAR
jgi:hypothetical protein